MISFIYNNVSDLNNFLNKNFIAKDKLDVKLLIPKGMCEEKNDILNTLNSFFVKYSISIEQTSSKNIESIIIFNTLIMQNNNLKKDLLETKKMALLGEMLANISHQWRQPLSIITSSASAMILHKELNILDDESFNKFSKNIISQGQFLAETIDVFRKYIKKDNIVKEVVLQDEISKILKLVNAVLKENNIEIINNINSKDKIYLKLVIGELSQVIINIINNAKDVFVQKNLKDRKIVFDLELIEKRCIFCIEDNAGGIDESIIGKIFDANFTTKEKNGTGLGLHMSYEIVTEHLKGDLYVKNTSNGAKFFIEIPL